MMQDRRVCQVGDCYDGVIIPKFLSNAGSTIN